MNGSTRHHTHLPYSLQQYFANHPTLLHPFAILSEIVHYHQRQLASYKVIRAGHRNRIWLRPYILRSFTGTCRTVTVTVNKTAGCLTVTVTGTVRPYYGQIRSYGNSS